jgi:tRNA A37 threonylcarbamoyladenosine dehydratase
MMDVSEDYAARFGGIGRLYGIDAMPVLAKAHVCVVGVGGVGSWTVEALARSGVGKLTLVDLDDICVNNTNRQLHTMEDTVGRQKIDVMAERARSINPEVEVEVIHDFFTSETLEEILAPGFDYLVDAIDHLGNKCLLIAACKERGIPVVVVGGAGGKQDPSMLRVDDLSQSGSDGLLRKLRRKLRKDHGFPSEQAWGIPCVFSREQAVFPSPDGGVCHTPPEGSNLKLDCASGFGTATFVTGTAGFMAAAIVVNALAGASS